MRVNEPIFIDKNNVGLSDVNLISSPHGIVCGDVVYCFFVGLSVTLNSLAPHCVFVTLFSYIVCQSAKIFGTMSELGT